MIIFPLRWLSWITSCTVFWFISVTTSRPASLCINWISTLIWICTSPSLTKLPHLVNTQLLYCVLWNSWFVTINKPNILNFFFVSSLHHQIQLTLRASQLIAFSSTHGEELNILSALYCFFQLPQKLYLLPSTCYQTLICDNPSLLQMSIIFQVTPSHLVTPLSPFSLPLDYVGFLTLGYLVHWPSTSTHSMLFLCCNLEPS